MSSERQPHIPEWARRERLADLAWLAENLHVFWPAAQAGYAQLGRGAITVDTMVQPVPGKGNPMWYLTQEQVSEYFGADEMRMVSAYDSSWEFVAILLKQRNRVSSYRMGVPEQRPKPKTR